MTIPTPAELLKYANLQMAAEAFIRDPLTNDLHGSGQELVTSLMAGNGHASVFTETQAVDFAQNWEVLDQRANTGTGFSGTLFKYTGATDAAKGLTNGEIVMSFRSTEFVDDAARDNQATNSMEVKTLGWAFGQIADMESWYADLRKPGGPLASGQVFSVTGYSLGGHLATAFDLLRMEDGTLNTRVNETYTFNGAGVGEIKTGTLGSVMTEFTNLRTNGSAAKFTDSDVLAVYQKWRVAISGGATLAQISAAHTEAIALLNVAPGDPAHPYKIDQAILLIQALDRVELVLKEILRLPGLSADITALNLSHPADIGSNQVDATKLDYQLAVLFAQQNTQPSVGTVGAGIQGVLGRAPGPFAIPRFYDVYGDTSPSVVSNSQLHYGQTVPVFIEDQPLVRGTFIGDAMAVSWISDDVKLLVGDYNYNDLGDTHSLVLLQDSLNVQNALAQLDTKLTSAAASKILKAASDKTMSWSTGTQGKAEGDVLENIVNALADMMGLGWQGAARLKGSLDGNTWAVIADVGGNSGRNTFYLKLKAVTDSAAYKGLVGKSTVGAFNASADAKSDFGAFLALNFLSPFAIQTTDAGAIAKLKQANATLAQAWAADAQLSAAQKDAGLAQFTQSWYTDRTLMLRDLVQRNERNAGKVVGATNTDYYDLTSNITIYQRANGVSINAAANKVVFGGTSDESINGTDNQLGDHLYGGSGIDTINGGKGNDYLQGDAGNDILNGGEGVDTLVGGTGSDTLDGGLGNDVLRGGAGNDTYKFTGTWGSDTIEDMQGSDKIEVNGVTLQGDKKIAEGVWCNTAQGVTYTLVGTGTDQVLEIRLGNNPNIIRIKVSPNGSFNPSALVGALANTGSPSVQGWPSGLFGLTMDDTVAVPAPGNPLTGDYAKATNAAGTTYLLDGNGNYIGTGPQANASDILLGSAAADVIQGMGGSDALLGYGGDDVIEGGDGADILMGGLGADTLNGGAGQDIIYGSSNGSVYAPTDTHYVAPVATFPNVFGQGFSWVMDSPNRDAEGIMNWFLSDNVQRDTQANDQGNIIDGGAGDDLILAGTGGDIVHGGADSDEIFGMGGSDQLFGDDGADRIFGDGSVVTTLLHNTAADQHGNDVIDGGAGNDILIGQGGDDEIFGGNDNDKLWGDDRDSASTPVTIHGNDYLDGEDGNDELVGGGRDDTLFGGSGDDKLWGDSGAASVGDAGYFDAAYHGDDYLDGEDGNDYLQGEGGDDTLFGGSGSDILVGDDDQARLDGQYHGDDYLDGEEGSDQMYGGGGDDTLYGGAGADLMYGDGLGVTAQYEGDDELYGEDGDDYLYGNGGNDYLDGGTGQDFISGGDGADTLVGGEGRNTLFGGDGNDVLVSSSGEDYLDGGDGNDTYVITTGSGQTLVDDALGTNTLEIDGGSANINDYQLMVQNGQVLLVAGNAGSVQIGPNVDFTQTFVQIGGQAVSLQQIVLQGDPAGALHAADVLVSGEMIATSLVTTAQSLLGSTRADALDGGVAADILQGGDGNDALHGGAGNDNLYGGDGADLIVGGLGDDVLFGGTFQAEADNQVDTYLFNLGDGHDQINGAGSGAGMVPLDIVRFGAGITAGSIQLTSGQGQLGSASSDLMITYGAGDTVTLGQGAFNELAEIQFADGSVLTHAQIVALLAAQVSATDGKIEASDAGSTLLGTAGNDYLHGGMGNDVLIGGAGNDRLQGKGGNNTYVFGAGSGLDRIELEELSADGGGSGEGAVLQFTDVAWSDLSLVFDGWDLLVRQPSGDSVRLVDFARAWPDAYKVVDRDGTQTNIRFLLDRQAPVVPASLADRRQQFIDLQYNQLNTALQRVSIGSGTDYNTNVIPDSVAQVGIQAVAGQTLQLESFLVPVTSQTVTKTYMSEQVYNEVTTTTPAHGEYFLPVPVPKPGQWVFVEIPSGAEPVYKYNEWASTLSVIGWRVPAAPAQTTTTWVPAGWQMKEVFTYSDLMFDDTATQAFVTGTAGDDLIVQAPSSLGYPPLFRGTIEAGDGNDVVILGSGSNSAVPKGFSRFEDWIGISAAFAGGWSGWTHPDYYQHGLGAWIDLGAGNDTVRGTDGNDFIIGGAGSDWMDGQAGADTYYIGYEAGSVDHISDLARLMGPGWDFGEGSDGGSQFVMPPNKDTVEFDGSVSISRLSYSWTTTSLTDPNAPLSSADTLQLYKDGELFLVIDYFDPFLGDQFSKAGVEQFKFSDGQVVTLTGLLAAIHPYDASAPPPAGTGPLSSTIYNDTLAGTAGDDVLDGWLGNDLLQGDRGNDSYILKRGYGMDTIQDVDATDGNIDVAQFGATISAEQLWFTQSGYDLQVSIIGTGDSFVVQNWYMGDRYHVEQFKTSDGKTLLDSQVQNLVQAMAGFSPPAAGQTTMPAGYASALDTVIAANWH
jgi:Ca2+-binding RTX toxin-like protein